MRSTRLILIFVTLILLTACGNEDEPLPTAQPTAVSIIDLTPTTAPTAAPLPTNTPEPVSMEIDWPPTVIDGSPKSGEELAVDGAITMRFDQPMDQESVAAVLLIEDVEGKTAVNGTIAWPQADTLTFTPDAELARKTSYRLRLGEQASGANGLPMVEPVEAYFQTIGALEVTQVIPDDSTQNVETDTAITAMFNRPVVPLVSSGQQADLPQPLTFEPDIVGAGEWVSTSMYRFTPAEPLAGATSYQVTMAELVDLSGAMLEGGYAWSFSTVAPDVVTVYPTHESVQVKPTTPITVTFNMPMDRASTETAVVLGSVNYTANLAFSWSDGDRVLAITPAEMLPLGETYQLIVGTGASSANGNANLAREQISVFTTVPYPSVLSTNPGNGQTADAWQYGVSVEFASPMNVDTLEDRVTITPAPDEIRYSFYSNNMSLSFGMERSTQYTITIPADAADPYGNTLGRDYTWTFFSPDAESLATFNLQGGISQFSRDFPTAVDVIYRNVTLADISLYDLGLNMNLINNPYELQDYRPASDPIRSWSLPIDLPENQIAVDKLQLADGGVLAPGFYLLTITTPETEADDVRYWQNQRVALIVADNNVVVKEMPDDIYVWVTRLSDGQADVNREVRLFNEQGAMVQTAVSDQNGFASFSNPHDSDYLTGYTVVSGDAGQAGFGVGSSEWTGGVSLWDMGVEARSYVEEESFSYVYSDRPIYRPDDVVYYKGIVRDPHYGRYAPPTARSVTLRLTPNGYYQDGGLDETIKAELDEYGHFSGEFSLPDGIALGSYSLFVEGNNASYQFTVADYRKPDFLIVMEADDAEVLRGTQTAVSLQADYFSGGGVSDAPVDWTMNAQPYSPHYDDKFYYFGDGGGFNYAPSGFFGGSGDMDYLGEGSGVTDADGHLSITLPANLLDEVSEGSKTVTVEAQVGGLGEFPVSSSTPVVMHAADGYVGVVAQETIADAGQETAVDLISIDWVGEPLPNQAIEVVFYQREWVSERKEEYSMYYTDWTAVDTEIGREQVTTGADGRAVAAVTPPEGGSYIAVATFTDGAGRTHTSSAPFWVYSADYGSWRTDQRDRSLELVADMDGYQTGDVAHILVQSPFPAPVQAWLTIERGDLIEQRLITLGSSSDTLDIPILAEYAPNVHLSLVVVKGGTPDSDYPWADIRFGVVNLPVSTEQLQLTIEMTPQETQVEPGETAVYDIRVTDYSGNPVQAELSLALVDLAVLSLKPDTTDIVEGFYYPQAYRSQTGSGLFISGEGLEVEVPLQGGGLGGGGGDVASESALARTPEGDDEDSTRTDFKDTAYWEAKIETDASGQAHVEIDLPDNATTWRLSSKAVSLPPENGSLVGQSTVDIVAALPLLVRPVTPRFFTVGDEMQIMAMVQNNTDEVLETAVSLTAAGLTLQDEADQIVTIAPHARELVQWGIVVDDVEFVDITIVAESGEYRDATKPSFGIPPEQLLPAYRYDGRDVVGTSGVLDENARRVEAILLPEGVDTRRGEVRTVLNGSLGAAIFESMEAREPYSWQMACASSLTDRLLPNTAVARAIVELDLDEATLKDELDSLIAIDVAALEGLNTPDGGWGWCYSNESDPWLTAYALLALLQAEQAGYATDTTRTSIASNYLAEELKPADKLVNSYAANRQAFFIYVLAVQGRNIIADADALVEEHRSLLDPYAKGYLLMAYELNSANSSNSQSLLSDLNGSAIVSATGAHWEDASQDYGNLSSDVRGTAVIIQALSMTDPQNGMIPSAVRWLMSARTALHWATTHETAWSLTALTDWAIASGDFEADYEYALLVNGIEEESGAFSAENLSQAVINSVAISDLSLTEPNYFDYQKQGEGNLYYTTHMDSYIAVEFIAPVARGISIQRTYYDAACDPELESCEPITQITAGEKVRVVLDIIAANDLVYATIEDPLPAGAEAIDPNLDTSPSSFAGGIVSDRPACWGCWGYWYFNRIEYRDEMVVFMSDFLPAGSYRYSYTLQTNIPGAYQVMPTFAREQYFPEVNGRSDGLLFVIE